VDSSINEEGTMYIKSGLPVLLAVICLLFTGCNNGANTPFTPVASPHSGDVTSGNTWLDGYYDVYIDLATNSATAVLNRTGMFTVNAVKFLNQSPANIAFHVNSKTPGTGFVDINMDISIKHPMAGLPQFNAYDLRGIFIGNGSGTLKYTSLLKFPILGTDQCMVDGPSGGGPDGFTRWFNPTEFTTSGQFGYTKGTIATKSYTGNATLNPYKYFADGLLKNDKLPQFLALTPNHGMFSAGATNTRNYNIRFPTPTPGLKFNYAVAASWKGTKPADNPANAPEAVACSVIVTPDIIFNSPTDFSGNLIADVTVYDWSSVLTGGVMQAYTIFLESSVLSAVHTATTPEMTPTASGSKWFRYHFSIPADAVAGLNNNTVWAIVKYATGNYSNPSGVPNTAQNDPLTSYFRFPVPVNPGITANHDISIIDFQFQPNIISVAVGDTVTWTNNGTFHHTASSDPLNPVAGGPESDNQYASGIPPGSKYVWTVPNVPPGTVFFFHCRFHGVAGNGTSIGTGMAGSITVL
jgi:plastocyanin